MIPLKKSSVLTITFISLIFLLIWAIGLGWSIGDYYGGKPDIVPKTKTAVKEPVKKEKGITIVALGDSLTRGTGDESGKGYVGYVTEEAKDRSKKDVHLMNLGINGQRSEQLRLQVQQKEVKRQLQEADFIFITIGGNDLFRGGQGLVDSSPETVAAIETKYLENVLSTFQDVRSANKNATIFFVGLYNPFLELSEGKEISKIIRKWNFDSAEISAEFPKIIFVPTFDLFELKVNDYLYSDKFHPNSKGYRLIAERVASLMTW
jgi:lysophospholipase L1-like esterase